MAINFNNKLFRLFLILISILLIGLAGYIYYISEINSIRKEKQKNLKSIADLKVKTILEWRRERIADAIVLSENKLLLEKIAQFINTKNNDKIEHQIKQILSLVQKNYHYEAIYLANTDAEILLSVGEHLHTLGKKSQQELKKSIVQKKSNETYFYYCHKGKKVHYDVIYPLKHRNESLGAIIFRTDPEYFIYPTISSWPIKSKTSETLIVRAEGDSVLFLNELRHKKNTALKLKIPLTNKNVPAVQAVMGYEGIWIGEDYRGKRVVSYVKNVPDTPWFMISKIDKEELYQDIRANSFLLIISILMMILFITVVILFFFSNRQKKIYRDLWISQKQFKITLNSIGDGVISTDKQGLIQFMNPIAEKMTGWKEKEALGKPLEEVFRIINENNRKKVENPVEKVLKKGRVIGLANHTMLISKSGTEYSIDDSGAPIRDKDDNIIGIVLVFSDKSKEREAEKKLRASQEKFKKFIELLPIPLFNFDNETGKILYFNKKFEEVIGYSYADIPDLDSWWQKAYPDPEYRQEVINNWYAAVEKAKKTNTEIKADVYKVTCKNGEQRTIIIGGLTIGAESLATFHDITEIRKAEQELIEKEEKFRTLFDHEPDAILTADPKTGRLLEVNKAAENLFKRPAQELIGMRQTKLHPPEVRADIVEKFREIAMDGSTKPQEIVIQDAEGKIIPVEVVGVVAEINHKPVAIGIFRDISERKKAEKKLKRSQESFQNIFDTSPVSLWEEDWTEVIKSIDKLRKAGIKNYEKYFEEHPDYVKETLKKVKILNVNNETLRMFEAENKEEMLGSLETVFATPDTLPGFISELTALSKGKELYKTEMSLRTVNEELINVLLTMSFPPKDSDSGRVLVSIMDITELKKAEAAIRKNEKKFRQVFEAANVGKSITKPGGEIKFNQAFARMLGYTPEELKKKKWQDLTLPEDVKLSRKKITPLLKGEKDSVRFEKRYIHKNGSIIWTDISTTIMRDADKKPLYFITTAVDITSKKEIEILIKKERDTLKTTINSIPGVFYQINQKGKFERWNNNFTKVTGYADAEMKGIHVISLFEGKDKQNVSAAIEKVFKTGYAEVEANLKTKDGKLIPYIFTGTLNEIDGENYLLGMGLDITKRKEIEKAIKENEEKLKLVIQGAKVITWDWNLQNDTTKWGTELTKQFGYQERIVENSQQWWEEKIDSQSRKKVEKTIIGHIENKNTASWREEYYFKKADNNWAYVIDWGKVIIDDKGKASRMIGGLLDITKRKEIEQKIKRLNLELKRKNKELEQVLYTTSHDLRSPLVNVQGFNKELQASLKEINSILLRKEVPKNIREQCKTIINEDIEESIKFILSSTDKMDALLSGLLTLSRVGRQKINRQKLNMDKLIEEVVSQLSYNLKEKNIKINADILPNCYGDKSQLNRVFSNLIGNAVKFVADDGSGQIDIYGESDKNYIYYYVKDNGSGIPHKHQDKIFKLFNQLDPHKSGQGLGLTIVKQIIEKHDGKIELESEEEKGTIFKIILPKIKR